MAKKPKPLTQEQIEKLLKQGAKSAAELNKQLECVFRLPNRILRLD